MSRRCHFPQYNLGSGPRISVPIETIGSRAVHRCIGLVGVPNCGLLLEQSAHVSKVFAIPTAT